MLATALISLVPPACIAGDAAETAAGTTVDAILEELQAIRQLLEKIEQQGLSGDMQRPSKPTTATVTISNKPAMGSPSAPVTVVEFSDYQCPYCLRFLKTTFPYLKRDYIDTGKVRWVALNLPLAFHTDARKAAQAAHCAGEQDKFWEMREVLFRNPRKLAIEHLPDHAARVGLDIGTFTACLASDRHLATIDQEATDAQAMHLTGTPGFIVGKSAGDRVTGSVIIGAQPLNVFNALLQKTMKDAAAAAPPADG